MLRTGVLIDRRYQAHDPGDWHPERSGRIAALRAALEIYHRPGIVPIEPRMATDDDLTLVHERGYIEAVAASSRHERFSFDPDTWTSSESHATARLATGGVLAVVDAVMAGHIANGFAFVRPPGHHAEAGQARGFCLFNSIAVAARHLRLRYGLERVMIVDWDVHHGNGTQHVFDDDPSVLYLSLHQYPHFPGTGTVGENGRGAGTGFTVNLPMPAGCGDDEQLELFLRVVEPICRQFAPQFVLVSAGFDGHHRDPLAGMRMSTDGYGTISRVLLRSCAEAAEGRCVATLEGGYDLAALTASALRVLDEMGCERLDEPPPDAAADPAIVEPLIEAHRQYWDLP